MNNNRKKLLKSGQLVKGRRCKRGERLEQTNFDFFEKCFSKKPASGGPLNIKNRKTQNADKTKNNPR